MNSGPAERVPERRGWVDGAVLTPAAILAGADTIEHASLIDAEGLRLARERGVALALDIEPGEYVEKFAIPAGWPQEFIDKMRDVLPKQRASRGGRIAPGP